MSWMVELVAWLAAGVAASWLWRAGRLERGGRLGAARRTARRAGFFVATAAGAVALSTGLAVGAAALLAGWLALLAALSGKPRPSGQAAVLLLAASAIARAIAVAC